MQVPRVLVVALLAGLAMMPLVASQNNGTNGNMTLDPEGMNGTAEGDDTGGSNTVVWIVVVGALIVLIYAYGRMKKPESKQQLTGEAADDAAPEEPRGPTSTDAAAAAPVLAHEPSKDEEE